MQPREMSKLTAIILAVLAFLGTLVSGCNLAEVVTGITPTPVTASPTPRVCPPIEIDSREGLGLSRTFLVVLFDLDSTDRQETLQYRGGSRTSNVERFIEKILPEVLGPGDEYSSFQLGFRTYEGARFDRFSSTVSEAPDPFPTPQPHQTLTPISTPDTIKGTGTPGLVILQQEIQYKTAVAAQQATSTQLAFEDLCVVSAYATANQGTVVAWTATNQAGSTEIATHISASKNTPTPIETPFAKDVLYEGLGHASIDFKAQCPLYDRCVLLIIDDLIDWRNTASDNQIPDYIDFDLNGVETIVVIPNCRDINSPSCTRLQDLWTDEFISFGAKNPIKYLNGDRLEERLLTLLGGN